MKKRWYIMEADGDIVCYLEQELHISPIMARVLANRGITDAAQGRRFISSSDADFHDPYKMKGMEKAVQRIARALEQHERIVIYGDYDVDGMTSVSLLYHVLRRLGGAPDFYIPDRQDEGYGPNEKAFRRLLDRGTELLITVDCGIAAYDVIASFQGLMDIIVTDHHEPPDVLPPAYVILNPKQRDDTYPYRQLAGVGVAYKLAQALWQYCRHEPLCEYSDLAALGTVADLVPLTGENRLLVQKGLSWMKQGHNPGIQALFYAAGLTLEQASSGRISYMIAPRLNAAGRLGSAGDGVRLLLAEEEKEAQPAALLLDSLNQERQRMEQMIAQTAAAQIEARHEEKNGVIVASGEGWHVGVIGIAASRLVETYYRPSLVIGVQDGIGKGSCRSIAGFNMYEALTYAGDLLLQFGGHPMAAGFSIEADKIDDLRARLNEYAAQHMGEEDYIPVEAVDMEMFGRDVTLPLIEELQQLEPYGMGNSRPVFMMRQVQINDIRLIGKDKQHVRVSVTAKDGTKLSGVGWSMAARADSLLAGDMADIAFQVEKNEFNGSVSPQLIIRDIHEILPAIKLDRKIMVDVYVVLKHYLQTDRMPAWQVRRHMLDTLAHVHQGHVIVAALQVLQEIGVLQTEKKSGSAWYSLPLMSRKMCLDTSPTYRQLSQGKEDSYGM